MPISLIDYLNTHPPAGAALHLMHCTSAQSSIKALESRNLDTQKCPIYGMDLLYMFYGRPAYKPRSGAGSSTILELAPVCLIFDPSVLASAVRILPFDSGGFAHYRPLLGPELSLGEFELGKGSDAPMRLVAAFYETNRNYYDQRPSRTENQIPVTRMTSRAYARLISDPSIREVDDRCGTVEVQFSTSISLKTALRAVVGPSVLLSDPDIQAALDECEHAVPLPYKTYGRSEPLFLAHALYERVDSFLSDQGAFV